MQKIKSLTIVLGNGLTKSYVTKDSDGVSGRLVHEIKSVGAEFESSIHSEYLMRDENGKNVAIVENCPVIIEYVTE